MAPELPDSLYSPEQLKACLFEMEELVAVRRRQEIKHKSGAAVRVVRDVDLSVDLTGLLGPAKSAMALTTAELEVWQEQLQEWLDQPVTHVTFAVPPPASTKLAMVRWFRTHTAPTALLKFDVNRNIVGGMVVRTPGKIFDFSFRRQLVQRRALIPEILNRA